MQAQQFQVHSLVSESGIPLKKCMGCRTNLPYDCFGLYHANPDGHNDYCRGCRRTMSAETSRRRKLGLIVEPVSRVPLRGHNRDVLADAVGESRTGSWLFSGEGVNDGSSWELTVDLGLGRWQAKLTLTTGGQRTAVKDWLEWHALDWGNFSEDVLGYAWRREIRLSIKSGEGPHGAPETTPGESVPRDTT